MMHEPLPANSCLRGWIALKQTAALQDSSCDPDRWRYPSAGAAYNPNEWPRHYLEIDWATPITSYPRDWNTVVQQLGAKNSDRNGRVPWRVQELYVQLVDRFKARDEAAVVPLLFVLSHYVTDAFSILHNTKNYDPDGLHARWETDMLGNSAQLAGIASLAKTYYGTPGKADPLNNMFDIVMTGNALVQTLINISVANAQMPQFYAQVKDLTARRWGDALTLYASIVWSAWAEAGAPALTGFPAGCSSAVPSVDPVLKGHMPAGGFTHPMPGTGIDAGQLGSADAGPDGGAPILPDGEFDAGTGTTEPGPSRGGGCAGVPAASLGAALVALLWLRRRR